jgi:hypothetical protein
MNCQVESFIFESLTRSATVRVPECANLALAQMSNSAGYKSIPSEVHTPATAPNCAPEITDTYPHHLGKSTSRSPSTVEPAPGCTFSVRRIASKLILAPLKCQ